MSWVELSWLWTEALALFHSFFIFFYGLLPFPFYCQNINAANTSPREHTLFIKRCTSYRLLLDMDMDLIWIRCLSAALLAFCLFSLVIGLSHNLNSELQLKRIGQLQMRNWKLQIANCKLRIENWNLIALFCKWANGKWGNCLRGGRIHFKWQPARHATWSGWQCLPIRNMPHRLAWFALIAGSLLPPSGPLCGVH